MTPPQAQRWDDRTTTTARANVVALLVVLPLVLAGLIPYGLRWGPDGLRLVGEALTAVPLWGFIVVLVLGTLVHELLHVTTWRAASGLPDSVFRIGFQWKTLTPYAHCAVPMTAHAYRWGAVAPGLVLGVLPVGLATLIGAPHLLLFGLFFALAAGGDALLLWLLRDVPADRLVQDHPTRLGCQVETDLAAAVP